jgi:hypothetical protein
MIQVQEDPVGQVAHTQYNVKQGLKCFGQYVVDAILKDVLQLNDREVIEPVDPNKLIHSEDKKYYALSHLMFLKEKCCGKIKGRGCADGRKQHMYITKEDSSFPTVSLEVLMLSCVIDAKEGRDVVTADIPRAFMQTDMDQTIYM